MQIIQNVLSIKKIILDHRTHLDSNFSYFNSTTLIKKKIYSKKQKSDASHIVISHSSNSLNKT